MKRFPLDGPTVTRGASGCATSVIRTPSILQRQDRGGDSKCSCSGELTNHVRWRSDEKIFGSIQLGKNHALERLVLGSIRSGITTGMEYGAIQFLWRHA